MKPEDLKEFDEVIITGTDCNGVRRENMKACIAATGYKEGHPNYRGFKCWPMEFDGKIWFDFDDVESLTANTSY